MRLPTNKFVKAGLFGLVGGAAGYGVSMLYSYFGST